MSSAKVVLVTGASSGLGQACARYLAQRDFRVFGTSRSARSLGEGLESVVMDVDADDSVARGIADVLDRAGRIDAVVNNAGFGYHGSIEDCTIEEARAQFETNVWGVLRVCRAVLPHMRANGRGHIVNVSSLAGRIALPFMGLYCASKFALEGLTESLRHEVWSRGIRVSLVEPGDFRTGFTQARRMAAACGPASAYHDACTGALAVMVASEEGGADPAQLGPLVARILADRSPRLRYTVGPAFQRAAVGLRAMLPAALFEWIVRRMYRTA